MKDGTVAEHGRHIDLIKNEQNYHQLFQHAHKREGGALREQTSPVREQKKQVPVAKTQNNFDYDRDDDVEFKDSGWRSYKHFVRAGGGWCILLTVFSLALVFVLIRIFITVWVKTWIDHGTQSNVYGCKPYILLKRFL